MHRTSLDRALHRTMVDHLDRANLGKYHPVIMGDGKATLRKTKRVVAPFPFETRVSRGLPSLAPSEEGFEGEINADRDVLQDVRVYHVQGGTLFFQDREGIDLPIARQTLAFLLPYVFTHFKQVVIEPTTLFKRCLKAFVLFLGGIDPILKVFVHTDILA